MIFECGVRHWPPFSGIEGFVQGSDVVKEEDVED